MKLQAFQEDFYNDGVDYNHGSPHLTHVWLKERLSAVVRNAVLELAAAELPLRVLEVGAGHGGFTEPALALGCQVTAVEMSRPSLASLSAKFATNPGYRGVFDSEGSLADVGENYSLVLAVAVLHHIPDYISFLRTATTKLAPGGAIVTLQDPLWFSRLPRRVRLSGEAAYLAWRLAQGDLARGIATRVRRLRRVYDESKPGDMVEYHVVRDGVDERMVADFLQSSFSDVSILPYWSHQLAFAQRAGDRFGWVNNFGSYAVGYGSPKS